jgi:hypothetical protein
VAAAGGADIGKCGGAKVEAASLCMYKVNGLYAGKGCKLLHEKSVAFALRVEPWVRVETQMGASVIEKVP